MLCRSKRDTSAVMIWETNQFDEDIRTARERRPLYDYNFGRLVEKFCEMARDRHVFPALTSISTATRRMGLSDAAMKPHFTLPYAPMKETDGAMQ